MEIFEKSETYFSEEHPFKTKNQELRNIFLTTSLEKTFKWSLPTYTLNHKNVLALGKFKNHYEIWFFNGVFLSDPNKVLLNAQEEKTKAMQQWRFTVKDTINLDILLAYSEEAIANKKKVKTCLYKKALLYFKNSRITNRCVKKNKTQQVLHTLQTKRVHGVYC